MDAWPTEADQALRREKPVAACLFLLQAGGLALFYLTQHPWALGLPLLLTLLALCHYDLRVMLLPDVLTLPLICTGFLAASLPDAGGGPPLAERLAGAAAGYGGLFLINAAYRLWRGRDGLGMGDAKLLAAAGAWLGILALPFLLLIASAAGLFAGIGLAVARRQGMGQLMIPFGPFIAFAFFLLWLWPFPL